MRLLDIEMRCVPGAVRLVGAVQPRNGERFEIAFEYPERWKDRICPSADPFVVAMLVPAMRAGEDLAADRPVSALLDFQLPRIRDILHTWFPALHRIAIDTWPAQHDSAPQKSPDSATYFSGGVDSFYTALKYLLHERLPSPLRHIIFMRGLETPLQRARGVEESLRSVEQIASELSLAVVTGTTDIRTHFPVDWEQYYVGAGLAATALSLSRGFGYVCIPAARSYCQFKAAGSTPLVDEMYSTERLRILHDGAEFTRAEKIGRIIEWNRDLVLRHLRVCVKNLGGAYNCGVCYKCVRTAVSLRALGVWQDAVTFPLKSMDHWEETLVQDHVYYTVENLEFAREHDADRRLVAMLERVVRRQQRMTGLRTFIENSSFDRVLPIVRKTRDWLSLPKVH